MPKLSRLPIWTAPVVLYAILYCQSLLCWFQMDDFAWLALANGVHDWPSLRDALFKPYAQGTIRLFSERLFFLGLFWPFGVDALPFRIVVFATQCLNLILLTRLAHKLTGSALTAIGAACLWVVNANIFWSLVWTSAYNQVLCCTVILGALLLFIRYCETGRKQYLAWQWLVFLLGFGVLEINVIYPLIAAAVALLWWRDNFRATLPMFAVSVAFALFHSTLAPATQSSIYQMHFDASLLSTLWSYLRFAFGAEYIARKQNLPIEEFLVCELLLGLSLFAFAIWRLRRGDRTVAFGLIWFVLFLAPYLPLRNHISDYYLTVPLIGLALLGGCAMHAAMQSPMIWKLAAATLLAIYALPSGWVAWTMTSYNREVSTRVKHFVQQLYAAHRRNPGKVLLIDNMDNELFWACFWDKPQRLMGSPPVYLTADTVPQIAPFPEFGSLGYNFLGERAALTGIRDGKVAVYEISGDRLRNSTSTYKNVLEAQPTLQPPSFIDAGSPIFSASLLTGWFAADGGIRWMGKTAEIEIAAPPRGGTLEIRGICPESHLAQGPLQLTVSINGISQPAETITASNLNFVFRYRVNGGPEPLRVTLETSRTRSTPNDPRPLGLAFGTFETY